MRQRYDKTYREDPKAYWRQHRSNNPVSYLLNQARYRAKKIGLEFDIELSELEVPERCPVFDIPLFYSPGKRTPNSYSLDRWDNTKGYVRGNVRIISWKANQYKGDLTIKEVERLLNYMKGI